MDLITVSDHVPTAGAIVWWRLSGIVNVDTLRAAWAAQGLDDTLLPSTASAPVALRRAVGEQRSARRLVRPLEGTKGYALVDEHATGADLDYHISFRVSLDTVGRLVFVPPSAPAGDPRRATAEGIRAAFDRHLVELSTQDISGWLVRMMPKLDAVGLRDTGGVYFVPQPAVEKLGRLVAALKASSAHCLHRVPALRSEDAVDAILDAIAVEAEAEALGMEKELAEAALGARGLENRVEHCNEVEGKVARYEALLGKSLGTLGERLERLRANLTVAMMKAQGTEGGASLANI
jgi:hypothetical protein